MKIKELKTEVRNDVILLGYHSVYDLTSDPIWDSVYDSISRSVWNHVSLSVENSLLRSFYED